MSARWGISFLYTLEKSRSTAMSAIATRLLKSRRSAFFSIPAIQSRAGVASS